MTSQKQSPDLHTLQRDVAALQTNVALLQQSSEKVIEPSLAAINKKLDGMSYVTVADFEEYKQEASKRSWRENTVSAVFGSMLTLVVAFMFDYLVKRGG